jgi:hypothetical protein
VSGLPRNLKRSSKIFGAPLFRKLEPNPKRIERVKTYHILDEYPYSPTKL